MPACCHLGPCETTPADLLCCSACRYSSFAESYLTLCSTLLRTKASLQELAEHHGSSRPPAWEVVLQNRQCKGWEKRMWEAIELKGDAELSSMEQEVLAALDQAKAGWLAAGELPDCMLHSHHVHDSSAHCMMFMQD